MKKTKRQVRRAALRKLEAIARHGSGYEAIDLAKRLKELSDEAHRRRLALEESGADEDLRGFCCETQMMCEDVAHVVGVLLTSIHAFDEAGRSIRADWDWTGKAYGK